jgi:hypothetical protein
MDLPEELMYKDFKIEITDLDETQSTYKLRVIEVPGHDGMQAGAAETVPFNISDVEKSIKRIEPRRLTTDKFLELGKTLGQMLLPGKAMELFNLAVNELGPGEGLRLRLAIEPLALAAIPWEYALVPRTGEDLSPNDFLVLRPEISIVRQENIGQRLDAISVKDKYRAVIALASPIGDDVGLPELSLDQDRRAIEHAIELINNEADLITAVFLDPATRDALEEKVAGAHIFHFAGHGVFDGVDALPSGGFLKKGKIVLEDEDMEPDFYESNLLANLLAPGAGGEGVRLVVLGACNSASRDENGAWMGVAPALVREKVPAVVAMQYRVGDVQASIFMGKFYPLVLAGYPVDQAVAEARRTVYRNPGSGEDWARIRDWGTPVLYLRSPDGVLFPQPKEIEEETGPDGQPILNARLKARQVSGKLTGVDIGEVIRGVINSEVEIDTVEEGGQVTGVSIGSFGGRKK